MVVGLNKKIITPGHGLIVDTFIMYGFVRTVLQGEGGDKRLANTQIKPEGEYFILEINEKDIYEIERSFYRNLHDAYASEVDRARSGKYRRVAAFQKEEEIFDELRGFLRYIVLTSGKLPEIFEIFPSPLTWGEWRSNRCKKHSRMFGAISELKGLLKDYTAHIPLSPYLGKYLFEFDKGVDQKQQKLCPLCASLAILGLLSYSVRMVLMGQGAGWQFVTIIPTKAVSGRDISLFNQAFGKDTLITPPQFITKMPEIITPLLLFKDTDTSILEILLQSSPMLFAYRFEPRPHSQVLLVRKVSEYPATRFIEFYLKVREKSSNLDKRLLDRMKFMEYSPFFAELALAILTKDFGHFYNFLRGFSTETAKDHYVSKDGKPVLFSNGFVEQALRFFK